MSDRRRRPAGDAGPGGGRTDQEAAGYQADPRYPGYGEDPRDYGHEPDPRDLGYHADPREFGYQPGPRGSGSGEQAQGPPSTWPAEASQTWHKPPRGRHAARSAQSAEEPSARFGVPVSGEAGNFPGRDSSAEQHRADWPGPAREEYGGDWADAAPEGYRGEWAESASAGYRGEWAESAPEGYRGDWPDGAPEGYRGDWADAALGGYRGDWPDGAPEGYRSDWAESASAGYRGERAESAPEGYRGDWADAAPEGYRGDWPEGAPEGYRDDWPDGAPEGYRGDWPDGAPEGYRGDWAGPADGEYRGERPGSAAYEDDRGDWEPPEQQRYADDEYRSMSERYPGDSGPAEQRYITDRGYRGRDRYSGDWDRSAEDPQAVDPDERAAASRYGLPAPSGRHPAKPPAGNRDGRADPHGGAPARYGPDGEHVLPPGMGHPQPRGSSPGQQAPGAESLWRYQPEPSRRAGGAPGGRRKSRADGPRQPGSPKRRSRGRMAAMIAVVVIVVPLLVGAIVGGIFAYRTLSSHYFPANYSGDGTGHVVVQIRPGDTPFLVAPRLVSLGVVASARAFVLAAEHSSSPNSLEPGFFRLRRHMNATAAWNLLLKPSSRIQVTVTIPEGLRVSQIAAVLGSKSGIPVSEYRQALSHPGDLGLPSYAHGDPEGYLYPDTYDIQPKTSAAEVLSSMVQAFNAEAASVNLTQSAAQVHLTPAQVITVASLAQAEGGRVSDFPKITRVIYNRLADGMKLQLDSTVLFANNVYGILATSQQLRVKSRYNTYLYAGLPPGPIDNPGDAAIRAALHPATGNWLYFVTVDPKTRQTVFTSSRTVFEHLQAELEKNITAKR